VAVIASEAKQSILQLGETKEWIASSQVLLAMTDGETGVRDPAARLRPDCARNSSPLDNRGRRESRVPSAPAASRAK
jgi:hypothetical protein